MKKILLATGNKNMNDILRRTLKGSFNVIHIEVSHHKFIQEIVDEYLPDIIIFHDTYLTSTQEVPDKKEKEWIETIVSLREEFEDAVRVVFLCEREINDPFLLSLIQENVLDIFRHNLIDKDALLEQLLQEKKFTNVKKIRRAVHDAYNGKPPVYISESDLDEDQETGGHHSNENDESEEVEREQGPAHKRLTEKVGQLNNKQSVPKTVEKKVINKNVIKRNYSVHITNVKNEIVGIPIEKKVIVVGSPFSGAGATFVSHLFADILSQMKVKTTYIENPYSAPYSYDRFSGHEIFDSYQSQFEYLATHKNNKDLDVEFNNFEDWHINEYFRLIALHPDDHERFNHDSFVFEDFTKLILKQNDSPFIIVDVGVDLANESVKDLMDIANEVFVVVPQDLSRIQKMIESNEEPYKLLRNLTKQEKVTFLGNRFSEQILNSEIQTIFKSCFGQLHPIQAYNPDHVFRAQYEGVPLLQSNKRLYPHVLDDFMPMLQRFFSRKVLKQLTRTKGFTSLFKKNLSLKVTDNSNT